MQGSEAKNLMQAVREKKKELKFDAGQWSKKFDVGSEGK